MQEATLPRLAIASRLEPLDDAGSADLAGITEEGLLPYGSSDPRPSTRHRPATKSAEELLFQYVPRGISSDAIDPTRFVDVATSLDRRPRPERGRHPC